MSDIKYIKKIFIIIRENKIKSYNFQIVKNLIIYHKYFNIINKNYPKTDKWKFFNRYFDSSQDTDLDINLLVRSEICKELI